MASPRRVRPRLHSRISALSTLLEPAGIFKGALIGGGLAGAVNLAIFFVGKAAGANYMISAPGTDPMPIPLVMPVAATMIAATVGAGVLIGLQKFQPARSWTLFLIITALVVVAYGAAPVLALGSDLTGILSLELMHLVAPVGVLWGIKRWGQGA